MTCARTWPARQHVAIMAVADIERQLFVPAAFAEHPLLARIGCAEHSLQVILAAGDDLPEHTVSLDHWGSPISRDRRCPFDLSRILLWFV